MAQTNEESSFSYEERLRQQRMEASDELDALFRRAVDLQDAGTVCEFMEWMGTVKEYSLSTSGLHGFSAQVAVR